jgi:hypothetical protein
MDRPGMSRIANINAPEVLQLSQPMFDAVTAVALNHPQGVVAAALVRVCAAILPTCANGGQDADALRFAAETLWAIADKRDAEQPEH